MSVAENKAAFRQLVEEVWNKGNLSLVERHVHPDFFWSAAGFEYKGAEGFKQMVATMREAFPDLHLTIEDMVGEEDQLAVRVTVSGTMKGTFMGIPPTGKQMSYAVAYFYRFKDGKELEAVPVADSSTMFQQLGISPPGQ